MRAVLWIDEKSEKNEIPCPYSKMSKMKLFCWSSSLGLSSPFNKINPGPLMWQQSYEETFFCVYLKLAEVCSTGCEETNNCAFLAGFWSVQQGYTWCRCKEMLHRVLSTVPHSLCALSCEHCENNNICSFVIKGFIAMHEHRGVKWRFMCVQLLNNFLNYSMLLTQLENQANLVSDGKGL